MAEGPKLRTTVFFENPEDRSLVLVREVTHDFPDVAAALRLKAELLGKSVDELTHEEKMRAFWNAILSEADVGQVETQS